MILKSLPILFALTSFAFVQSAVKTEKKQPKNRYATKIVNLSQESLTEIPSGIQNNPRLRVLDLSYNSLTILSQELAEHNELRSLNLSNNPKLDIHESLKALPSKALAHLNLAHCNLYALPTGFDKLKGLKSLDLSNNFLTAIPSDFKYLEKLEKIDLSGNQLKFLDWCPSSWWNLKELDVRDNPELNHKDLLEALTYLDGLDVLKIDNVSKVNKHFADLKVERLELYDSPNINFKGALAHNQQIQEIVLSGNLGTREAALFNEINTCLNLRKVIIKAHWTIVPKSIQVLNTVTDLDLSGNRLYDVSALEKLSGLSHLNLSGNPVSSESLISLQVALPNCQIRMDQNIDMTKQKIEKPFAMHNLPEQHKKVMPGKKIEVEFTSTKLSIPDNAFVDADGQPVTEAVILDYQEYMNPAEILLSGIPMGYDSAGVRYDFSSAGMFDLGAKTESGQEVFMNREAPISVEMKSMNTEDNFNLYDFDSTRGKWNNVGTNEVVPDLEQENRELNSLALQNNMVMQFNRQMAGFRNRLMANRTARIKYMPEIKRHFKQRSFTLGFEVLESWHRKNNLKTSTDRMDILRDQRWVYDGVDADQMFKFMKEMNKEIKGKYRNAKLPGGLYSSSAPALIHSFSLRPSETGNNFLLSFKFKDSLVQLNVYPKMDEKPTHVEVKTNQKIWMKYLRLNKRDQRKNRMQLKKMENINKAILKEMRAAGIEQTIEELINYDFRRPSITSEMVDDDTKRILERKAQTSQATRLFQLSGFGLFNCDRIMRMIDPQPVLASFVDAHNQPLRVDNIYLMEFDQNGVLAYKTTGDIVVDRTSSFNLVFMIDEQTVGVVRSNNIKISDLGNSMVNIPVKIEKIKSMSTQEFMNFMMS